MRAGIEQALENDILTFSRKPNIVTDKARRRKQQFQRWFVNIFDVWYRDVTDASNAEARECLTDNFPYDSPGNLDRAILGSDCVLDLTSVENICQNLKVFFQWSTENCQAGDRRIATLERRCDKIDEIRQSISQNL